MILESLKWSAKTKLSIMLLMQNMMTKLDPINVRLDRLETIKA